MAETLSYYKNLLLDTELDSSPLGKSEPQDFAEHRISFVLEEKLLSHLAVVCTDKGYDFLTVLKAAWAILLAKYSNAAKTLFADSYQSKLYPVFLDFEAVPQIAAYVKALEEQQAAFGKHTSFSFEELCREFDLNSLPIITTERQFFEEFSLTDVSFADIKLCILISMENKGAVIYMKYHGGLYEKATMERLYASYHAILTQIGAGVEQIAAISALSEDMVEELEGFNHTECSYDDSVSVVDLICRAVEQYPENIAVVYKEKKITYGELGEMTDRIAQYVQSLGIGKEEAVSILLPRCEYMPIAAVGVLKAGAAYQPLDPTYPMDRLKFMMEDADAKLLIADSSLLHLVPDYSGTVLTLEQIEGLPACNTVLQYPKKEDLFILLYTSGSTGVPKGVMLEHQNLVAFCNWYQEYYQLTANSRVAAYASFGFDANMMDTYPALTCGASVHIIEEAIRLELLSLKDYFVTNQITHSFITTQVGRQFADMFPDCEYPHYLSVGGEALVPVEPPKGYQLFNVYGPTECTIFTTIFPVDRLYKNVPIGKALHNLKLYITDKFGNRVPIGVAGELCVAGPQVSRGYLNRPEQTEEVFIENKFCTKKGYERIYRTGDIVRFLPDGNVEFIDRRDSQVKIRGFRIELTEVESIIREFEGIKDATVVAFDEAGGGKYIAAYIVADTEINIEELNAFILKSKPPYMVPAVTMQLDKIPLNQNQKVNKRALPKAEKKKVEIVAPENEVQQKICDCLEQIVGHREFGITTDFYEAGLTSIGAMKLIVMLSEEFQVIISTKNLKGNSTPEALAAFVQSTEQQEEGEVRDKYPLTQTQMGIYVECMMNRDSVLYNLPAYLPLEKDTDVEKLCEGIRQVIHAHPAVNCKIHADENGDIFMYPEEEREVAISVLDGTEEEFEGYFKSYAKPFDFEQGPLYRFAVFKTEKHTYLVLDIHHIVSDGSSMAVFVQELDRAMKGEELLGEVYSQFDLAVTEEKRRKTEEYQKAKAYYDSVFASVNPTALPDRDVYEETEKCGFYKTFCDSLSVERVEEFCRKQKITPNVFFTSVMGYVIGKYANEEEACFTTIYNGRDDARTANMLGMLVKTLPVYADLEEKTEISSYLAKMQEQLLASMNHDLYSFAEISRAYNVKADIMFVYQGDDFVEFEIDGQTTTFHEGVSDKAKAAVSINIFLEQGRYRYEFEYREDMYSRNFIKRMYDILVEGAKSFMTARTLGDVNITSEAELEIIESFNNTAYPVEIVTVNKLFEEQVRLKPEATAVIACGETLTYSELNRLANRLAQGLLEVGLEMGAMVGLILERNKYVYIVRQGILKAGGAFLPLVPEYPEDRIDFCLRDSECPYVITTEAIKKEHQEFWLDKSYQVLTVEELLACDKEENPDLPIPVDSLAYCLYTSGSTGKPKGVMIEHQNLCNFVNSNPINTEITNYTENGVVSLALAAITFDVSVMEEFIPLCNGMTICMANEEEIHNPLALAKLLTENHVDIMKCTPSYMTNIIEVEQIHSALAGIKAFDIGAEAFPSTLYGKMRRVNKTAAIVNSYGPTECTVSCTTKILDSGKNINIGGPLTNMQVYVVNRKNKILPRGISGELIICGAGVGRGYVNLPEKNKEAFFNFKGQKAYHSGDLVRWTEDGEIDFQGRLDNQIKLRGLRVELDEIENAIHLFEGIKMSKVVVKNNGSEEFLAGYFTADREIDIAALTAHLKSILTYYMVPGALMQLEKMPLTVNGKIDKKQLPEISYVAEQREYVAPETPLEKELCDKFGEILNLEQVGVTDNFFEIGGTSLSATKIATYAITKGYSLVYKDVFANPTPGMLAKLIRGNQEGTVEKSDIPNMDYLAVEQVLAKNCMENVGEVKKGDSANILLTGATGFLGIHVLREFLINYTGMIYCLVRKGKYSSCEKRLMNMLMYYFDNPFTDAFENRIVCIDGDITDKETMLGLSGYDFSTVINCAACVKHFVKDDTLDKINVEGVKNIIELCKKAGKRLVQISTTSVAGEGNNQTVPFSKRMKEHELYFGQIVENDYIRTKFLAEYAILTAVAEEGLDGKIVRVGNLMSRKSDGEFQINFVTNGFMRALNSYKILGKFPIGGMHNLAEFSPIDSTAAAVLTLALADTEFTVFHAYNSHQIYMSDVIYAMRAYGFDIEIVSDAKFEEALKEEAEQDDKSEAVLGLIAYATEDESPRYEIMADNRFTTEVLYRLDYKWPITDDAYLENAIRALDTLEFFE